MQSDNEIRHLIVCNIRNIFLEKSYTKSDGETSPDPFLKNLDISAYLWINSLKFHTICVYCMPG